MVLTFVSKNGKMKVGRRAPQASWPHEFMFLVLYPSLTKWKFCLIYSKGLYLLYLWFNNYNKLITAQESKNISTNHLQNQDSLFALKCTTSACSGTQICQVQTFVFSKLYNLLKPYFHHINQVTLMWDIN